MSPIQQLDLSKLLKGVPNGAWVAVSRAHDKVLAYGFDLREVKKHAQDLGESEPLLLRVPELAAAMML